MEAGHLISPVSLVSYMRQEICKCDCKWMLGRDLLSVTVVDDHDKERVRSGREGGVKEWFGVTYLRSPYEKT